MSVGAIRAGRAMVEIFADSSQFVRALAGARGALASFAASTRRLGTLQIMGGVAIAAPIAAAVKEFSNLEGRLNEVRALSGASARQMLDLAAGVSQVGLESGRPLVEVARAMGELSRAGVAIGDIKQATAVISDFSLAAGVEMGRSVEIGIQTLTAFGLETNQLVRVTDVMQEMANATVSDVESLADGFRYAGQSSKLFGLSLEEAGSAIAFLQQSGLTGSTAGTAFNQFLLQTVQNVDKLEGALGPLRDAGGDPIPMVDILAKLRDAVSGMGRFERLDFLNKMFDVRGMRGAAALVENIEGWSDLLDKANNSMGSTRRKSLEMAKSFENSFFRMANGVRLFAVSIGAALEGDLRNTFSLIGNFAAAAAKFVDANRDMVRAIAATSAGLVVSGVAFFTVGTALQLALFAAGGFTSAIGLAMAPFGAFAKISASVSRTAAVLGLRLTRVAGIFAFLPGLFASAASALGRMAAVAAVAGMAAARSLVMLGIAATRASLSIGLMAGIVARNLGAALAAAGAAAARFGGIIGSIAIHRFGSAVWYAGAAVAQLGSVIAAQSFAVGARVFGTLAMSIGTILGPIFAVAGSLAFFAGVAGAAAAAVAVVAVAAGVLQTVFSALTYAASSVASGLGAAFGQLASSAAAVWPEIQATVTSGFSGIAAAINAQDLSLAWRVFKDTAKAAFAEIMMIVGPWVDAFALIGADISSAFAAAFSAIADAATSSLSFIGSAFSSAFSAAGDAVSSLLSVFSPISDALSGLADYASTVGKQIFDALSTGDLTKAWIIGVGEIRKLIFSMQATAAGVWDSVANPIKLAAVRLAERGDESSVLRSMTGESTPDVSYPGMREDVARRTKIARDLFNASTGDEYAAARSAATTEVAGIEAVIAKGREPNATPAERAASDKGRNDLRELNQAMGMVATRMRELGIKSSSDREREIQNGLDAIGAETAQRLAGVDASRAAAADRRRKEADRAQAVQAGSVNAALGLRAQQQLGTQISSATSLDEMAVADAAFQAAISGRDAADRSAGLQTAGMTDAEAAAAREEAAVKLRMSAAEEERDGNLDAAAAMRGTATALEQAIGGEGAAALMDQLNAQWMGLQEQLAMRGGLAAVGDAADGQRNAAAMSTDVVGSFSAAAADRMGFGRTLAEKQLEVQKGMEKHLAKVVRLVEEGGVFAA